MAQEHGMIEPFEPNQVKMNAAGERMVSYGTSSYGYDIRCSREFKLFTNLNSTIVDPKNFDPNSFVEVNADYCIIPVSYTHLDVYKRQPAKCARIFFAPLPLANILPF